MGLLPGTSPANSTDPSPPETSEGRNHRTAPAGGMPGGAIPATRLRALVVATPPRRRKVLRQMENPTPRLVEWAFPYKLALLDKGPANSTLQLRGARSLSLRSDVETRGAVQNIQSRRRCVKRQRAERTASTHSPGFFVVTPVLPLLLPPPPVLPLVRREVGVLPQRSFRHGDLAYAARPQLEKCLDRWEKSSSSV